ncbi:DUF4397 domain-containing protein [Burkholderia sp. MS455]|uniref:DUF4397 domain-containing protein n=1 Tax=Burkholderia sp. MS455 TaxID=2811788 RepID=UPI00195DB2BE|nr:DUF4397 domain-containing protein [Burkholderia sp. MS455]QRR07532.1 DUF4397 domain-containing protein [Burkholderia sp. MS455]
MKPSTTVLRYLIIACTASALGACGGDNDAGELLGITKPAVRFVNAVPTTSLDIYRNGKRFAFTQQDYPAVSKLGSFSAGVSTFSARGSNHPEQGDIGVAGSINGDRGHRYLLSAFPSARSTTSGSDSIDLRIVDDPHDYKAPLAPTLRILNAAANTQAVDVYVTRPQEQLSAPTVTSLAYQATWPASGVNSFKLPATGYRIRVSATGDPGNILFDSQTINAHRNADLIAVLLPARIAAGPISRGDLKMLVDDANSNDATREIIDHSAK